MTAAKMAVNRLGIEQDERRAAGRRTRASSAPRRGSAAGLAAKPVAAGRRDPERQPDHEREQRRDEDLDQRLHRVLPEAHQRRSTTRQAAATIACRGAADEQGDASDDADRRARPGPCVKTVWSGLSDHVGDGVLEPAGEPRDVASQPVDDGIDRFPERDRDVARETSCAERDHEPADGQQTRRSTSATTMTRRSMRASRRVAGGADRAGRWRARSAGRGRWPG